MLPGELKWNGNVKSDDRYSDLISDYKKPAPLPLYLTHKTTCVGPESLGNNGIQIYNFLF